MRYQRGYEGYYQGQYCRSLGELHLAIFLDKFWAGASKSQFVTEPFRMTGVSGRKKVPDFASVSSSGDAFIWEVKNSDAEVDETRSLYEAEFPWLMRSGIVKFVNGKTLRHTIRVLMNETHGPHEYDRVIREFKNQNSKVKGFPGELNPRYGVKASSETRLRLRKSLVGKMSGKNNPRFGQGVSPEVRAKIGTQWRDPVVANRTRINSLMNRLSKLSDDQYDDFVRRCIVSFSTGVYQNPGYMNGVMRITEKRVIDVFGTFEYFWNSVRNR